MWIIQVSETCIKHIFHQAQTPEYEKLESVEDVKQQSHAQYQELVNDLYNIHKDLHDTRELCDKVYFCAW